MNRIFPGHRQSRPPTGSFTINRDSPQAKGLVAWWPTLATRGGTSMFDLSGYSQMGAIGSDLSWSMLGERGPSIYGAAGAAAYVEVPDLDVQDTIRTATFWYASNM